MVWAWLAALVLFMGLVAQAKHSTGTATLVSGRVTQVAKFSFRPGGTAEVRGKLQYRGPEARGAIYLFMDTEWEKYHSDKDHCSRMNHASAKILIGSQNEQYIGKGVLKDMSTTKLVGEADAMVEYQFTWEIEHYMRTYGYYLVIGDCDTGVGAAKRFRSVYYQIDFLNFGYDHFPADEHGLFTLYIVCFAGLVGFAMHVYYKQKRAHDTPSSAKTLLFVSYVAELLSILCELIHLTSYWSNGYGMFVFDFMSEIFEGMAQLTLAYLLLALAGGWTLIEGAITAKTDGAINPEALGDDHASTMFVSLLSLLTILLQLLNKLIVMDDFAKFHDHDTWPGFILVLMRALLAVFFTYQMSKTLKFMTSRGRAKRDTVRFAKILAVLGGLWFWVFPLLVLLASVFAHYLRHRLVSGGVLFLQTSCLILLSSQILAKQSAYTKASVHGGTILGDSWGRE
ncbi:hypothetical protein BASA81_015417 [Batrachochytrium salamandrivorans]|nr:hypothetical protein BASA81_015417 [Batrachochytrium salamandrivorans]